MDDSVKNNIDIDIRAIVSRLDCISEAEFCQLFQVTPTTAKTWRNRGVAPLPIRLGNAYYYTLDSIKKELTVRAKKRRRTALDPSELLA
jgi:hypothetical protein